MNEITQRLIPYRAFLADQQQRIADEASKLETENRQDEANMLKIRLNIYGVFETVASADEKQSATWQEFCARYEPRFDTLTAPWNARLTSAVRNSDTKTRLIEELKLSTARRIREEFDRLKEIPA